MLETLENRLHFFEGPALNSEHSEKIVRSFLSKILHTDRMLAIVCRSEAVHCSALCRSTFRSIVDIQRDIFFM